MKLSQKILSIFLVLPMVLGLTVHAQTNVEIQSDFSFNYITDGWWVEFSDKKMKQNFHQSDIDEVTSQLQPGDSWTIKLEVRNEHDGYDWYMSNKVIQTYEETEDGEPFINEGNAVAYGITKADNGAYTYKLLCLKDGQERVIYDSENIGGDNRNGLHQATESLEDYFYLDSYNKGDKALLTLIITCDGETLNNDYQNSRAVVQMNFATQDGVEVVKTGDTTNIALYVGLAAASAIGVAVVLILLKKNKKDEETENDETKS